MCGPGLPPDNTGDSAGSTEQFLQAYRDTLALRSILSFYFGFDDPTTPTSEGGWTAEELIAFFEQVDALSRRGSTVSLGVGSPAVKDWRALAGQTVTLTVTGVAADGSARAPTTLTVTIPDGAALAAGATAPVRLVPVTSVQGASAPGLATAIGPVGHAYGRPRSFDDFREGVTTFHAKRKPAFKVS